MAQYGIGVSNIFDALSDGDVPVEVAEVREDSTKKPAKGASKASTKTESADEVAPRVRQKVDDRNKLGGAQKRGDQGAPRGGRDGAVLPRPGKKQFDRRGPMSGPRGEARKGGFGLGPEGGDDQQQTEVVEEQSTEVAAETETPSAAPAADDAPVHAEEIDNSLTLDQFLASRKALDDDVHQVRAVIVDEKSKKLKAMNVKEEPEHKEEEEHSSKARKGKTSIHWTEFVASTPAKSSDAAPRSERGSSDSGRGRGRGGGGFRGGDRGGFSRGGARGGFSRGGSRHSDSRPVNVNDESAFPSLGGK